MVGVALRWYSVIYLGRFFTANVAILKDHQLVDTGPYRFVRHPSYTGVRAGGIRCHVDLFSDRRQWSGCHNGSLATGEGRRPLFHSLRLYTGSAFQVGERTDVVPAKSEAKP